MILSSADNPMSTFRLPAYTSRPDMDLQYVEWLGRGAKYHPESFPIGSPGWSNSFEVGLGRGTVIKGRLDNQYDRQT